MRVVNSGVKLGTVWDRTTEVIGGRFGILATIAVLALFIPSVISDAWTAYALPPSHMTILVGGILALASLVATIWGQLAVIAVATDPATTQADAMRQASARLPPAIGVTLLLVVAAIIVILPIFVVLAASGMDFTAAMNTDTPPAISPGAGLFVFFYSILLAALMLWIGARFAVLNPVIVNERLGLGAIRRSIALTRGQTWKLIGLILLAFIVIAVTASAAQFISGIVFRLILGEGRTAPFLTSVVVQIVATGFAVVAAVFAAQLYLALRGPVTVPE